jgi:hypothetical protein
MINNYNIMINNPDHDPFNNNKKLDSFGCNLYKYNCVIMLSEGFTRALARMDLEGTFEAH